MQQSGFDPKQTPTASSPPPQQESTGPGLGGVRSQRQNRRNQQARQDWERQQAAQYQNARNGYNRAFAACIEARGYSIS